MENKPLAVLSSLSGKLRIEINSTIMHLQENLGEESENEAIDARYYCSSARAN